MIRFLTLFLFLVLSLPIFGKTLLVEMEAPLSSKQLKILTVVKELKSVALFSDIDSSYFSRLYEINYDGDVEKLKTFSFVVKVESDHRFAVNPSSLKIDKTQDIQMLDKDPLSIYQWGLQNQKQIAIKEGKDDIHIREIHGVVGQDIGWSGIKEKLPSLIKRDVVVAVIDSGIDYNHPDLKGLIAKNMVECRSDGTIEEVPTGDRDQNGYDGDCLGWNFTTSDPLDMRDPTDEIGHGTHVASIISAVSGNNLGISGVSPRIKLLPVKVYGNQVSEDKNLTTTKIMTRGIIFAVRSKVDVINLSLGWPRAVDSKYLREAVQLAIKRNIVVVAAAGNNSTNTPVFPCSHHNVICVAAVGIDGGITSYTNYGGDVDLLAPGDNILGLSPYDNEEIERNFPVKGIDLKNGTSQAAPFVSLSAAILKGVYPGIGINEIKARLFESAATAPNDNLKGKTFQHGLINLKAAIELEKIPSVKPAFKGVKQVIYSPIDMRFRIVLPLKNYWGDLSNIKIRLSHKGTAYQLNRSEYRLQQLKEGTSVFLEILGKVIDAEKDRDFDLQVDIVSNGENIGSYTHYAVFVVNSSKDPRMITKTIKFKDKVLPLGKVLPREIDRRPVMSANIMTVTDLYNQSAYPDYWLRFVNQTRKGMEITLFGSDESQLIQKEKPIFIKYATKLLLFYKMDFNYDGQLDYLIISLLQRSKQDRGILMFSYYDKDLNPLYGKYSQWQFRPENDYMLPRFQNIRFLSHHSEQLGKIAIPAFLTENVIPLADMEQDRFKRKDYSAKEHLYFLQPKFKAEQVLLETRIIDNDLFLDHLRKQMKLQWYENISFTHGLTQDQNSFKEGRLNAILSVGNSYPAQNFIFSFHDVIDGIASYEILDNQLQGLGHFSLNPMIRLDESAGPESKAHFYAGSSLVGFNSIRSVQMISLQSELPNKMGVSATTEYLRDDKLDFFVGFIAGYKKGDDLYSFFQTQGNLLLVKSNQMGVDKVFSKQVRRVRFLDKFLFSETFFPIAIKDKAGKLSPALFVNETEVSGNMVHLLTADEESLKAPIKHSVFVPSNCTAMNPIEMDHSYAYSFLCKEKDGWSLKYLPLK